MVVNEASTSLGRCYLFRFRTKFQVSQVFPLGEGGWSSHSLYIQAREYVILTLNMAPLEGRGLDFFIFEGGAELGLQSNYWTVDVLHYRIRKGQVEGKHFWTIIRGN